MDWITETIAIGNHHEASDPEFLRRERIVSILSLNGALRKHEAASLGVQLIEDVLLEDGPGNDPQVLHQAVRILGRLVRDSPPVLVHCTAGRSRSPTVVAGYLMTAPSIKSEEAIALIAAKRRLEMNPALRDFLNG